MMTVAILADPPEQNLGESIKLAQRLYKLGHEPLNLCLIHLHDQIVCRSARKWEQSYEHLVVLCDAVIIFHGLESYNTLTAYCMEHNIPVFTSFEEFAQESLAP